ncbi:unnamed protein product [Schistosoma mattheei]|uniref:MARVEL domain-containing protein n=2 Tax=Schistosoma mattheei TaxID=31246 RepID=A0AA85C1L1_9TREM|nr:unnamed protein product [Schistosoma mattheei]
MSLNTAYASTIPAVFKIVEIILNIILIILVAVSPNYVIPGPGGWLFFVAILTTLISLFFYCIHLTNAIYRFSGPMTLIEFICIAICSGFHLIAMIVCACTVSGYGTAIAAAVSSIFTYIFIVCTLLLVILSSCYKSSLYLFKTVEIHKMVL